jgi:hypothetical protein
MSGATKYHEPLNRPLTTHERDLILWLLDHPEEGNPANNAVYVNPWFLESDIPQLKAQIDALTVVSKCTCGCPTVDFALEGIPIPRKGEHVIRDYLATVDGEEVGIMLFQNDGRLSSLEVYSAAGTDKPFGLPEIEAIFSWE